MVEQIVKRVFTIEGPDSGHRIPDLDWHSHFALYDKDANLLLGGTDWSSVNSDLIVWKFPADFYPLKLLCVGIEDVPEPEPDPNRYWINHEILPHKLTLHCSTHGYLGSFPQDLASIQFSVLDGKIREHEEELHAAEPQRPEATPG